MPYEVEWQCEQLVLEAFAESTVHTSSEHEFDFRVFLLRLLSFLCLRHRVEEAEQCSPERKNRTSNLRRLAVRA